MTPFDFVKAITTTKTDIYDDQTSSQYIPYVVNKALSYYPDTILYAQEMNLYPSLDSDMQYYYLLNTVKKSKRQYVKWMKKEKSDDLEAVSDYFNCSHEKAKVALKILSEEQLQVIKQSLNKGGNNERNSEEPNRSNASKK